MTKRVLQFAAILFLVLGVSGCNLTREVWALPKTLLSLPKTAMSLPGDVVDIVSNPQGVINSLHEMESTVAMPPSEIISPDKDHRNQHSRE